MAYMDGKAAGRANTTDKQAEFHKPRKAVGNAGNQEAEQSPNMKPMGPNTSKFEVGNQVRVKANERGTGTFKSPLNSYKRTVLSANENPDGGRNRNPQAGQGPAKKSVPGR